MEYSSVVASAIESDRCMQRSLPPLYAAIAVIFIQPIQLRCRANLANRANKVFGVCVAVSAILIFLKESDSNRFLRHFQSFHLLHIVDTVIEIDAISSIKLLIFFYSIKRI